MKKAFVAVIVLLLSVFAYAADPCVKKDAAAVIKVFDGSIALNEKFKRMHDDDFDQIQRARRGLERNHEERLTPCLERAVVILSTEAAPQLLHKLLEVALSYENSADEAISYSIALVFGKSPGDFEAELQRFSAPKRRLLMSRLSAGWLSAKTEFSSSVVRDRESRLRRLGAK